jgi:GNAT superfamily N-acetyltransferase
MMRGADYLVRDYAGGDEPAWLRGRLLSLLSTAYSDDVVRTKPTIPSPGFELVAIGPRDAVAGLMDVTVEDTTGTIDNLAVHPDRQHRGIARSLLTHAIARAPARRPRRRAAAARAILPSPPLPSLHQVALKLAQTDFVFIRTLSSYSGRCAVRVRTTVRITGRQAFEWTQGGS